MTKKYNKRIKSQLNNVDDIRDLLRALKLCSNDDLYLIMALCDIVLDDREEGIYV